MKIGTKGRYGLKAMVDIATESSQSNCVNLKSIALRQGIPENYLEQIISLLKKAGFVKSVRGAAGGYCLNVSPSELTVGDILRVLEGSLSPVVCVETGGVSCGINSCESCVTKGVWEKIYDKTNEVVDSITLESLINSEGDVIIG